MTKINKTNLNLVASKLRTKQIFIVEKICLGGAYVVVRMPNDWGYPKPVKAFTWGPEKVDLKLSRHVVLELKNTIEYYERGSIILTQKWTIGLRKI